MSVGGESPNPAERFSNLRDQRRQSETCYAPSMANQLTYLEAARAVAVESLQKAIATPTAGALDRLYALNSTVGVLTDAIERERRAAGRIT